MGCCGQSTPQAAPIPPSDWVLLEYVGTAINPISFYAHATRAHYRAGRCCGKHQVYVHPADVDQLVRTNEFVIAPVAEPEPEPIVEPDSTDEPTEESDEPEVKAKRGKK